MNIPGLGAVTQDEQLGWYFSKPLNLPLLNGSECRIVIDGYDGDQRQQEFHSAIANLLACDFSVLQAAEQHIYEYYRDMNGCWKPSDDEYLVIESANDVWRHIQFGSEPGVMRRAYGDKAIYVSIECNCDWEPEHGLQIVLKNGKSVVKVGPYDGHLTNADAYADASLENVIYRGI